MTHTKDELAGLAGKEPLSIARVVQAIRTDDDSAYVVQLPQNVRVQPPEIWVPSLGVWVREDGFSIQGDNRHGSERVYPGPIGRWRIRRAIRLRVHLEMENGG